MTKLRIFIWVLLSIPMLGAAEHSNRGPGARSNGRSGFLGPRRQGPVSAEEWNRVKDWLKQHCPNRYRIIQNQGLDNDEGIRQLATERYRTVMAIKFPALKAAMVNQIEAQDAVFGDQMQLKLAGTSTARKAIESKLKGDLQNLFDCTVKEEEARVARLQQQLHNQSQHKREILQRWFDRSLKQINGNFDEEADSSDSSTQASAPDAQ